MKKSLTFLSLLCLSTPAFAEFSATDNVLFFYWYQLAPEIKETFTPGENAAAAAQKYIEVMDNYGNVSIAGLKDVCVAGGISDDAECRKFMVRLVRRTDYFSWAKQANGAWPGGSGTYINKDGSRPDKRRPADDIADKLYMEPGQWLLQYQWMTDEYNHAYPKAYPGYTYMRGTSACESSATLYNPKPYLTHKSTLSGKTGSGCWCKITEPVKTLWVYFGSFDNPSHPCASECARLCQNDLRYEAARSVIFPTIKNEKTTKISDERLFSEVPTNSANTDDYELELLKKRLGQNELE